MIILSTVGKILEPRVIRSSLFLTGRVEAVLGTALGALFQELDPREPVAPGRTRADDDDEEEEERKPCLQEHGSRKGPEISTRFFSKSIYLRWAEYPSRAAKESFSGVLALPSLRSSIKAVPASRE